MKELKYIDKQIPTFIIKLSKIEGRLDPYYYNSELKKFTTLKKYPIKKVREVVTSFKTGFGVGRENQAKDSNGIIQIRPTNLDENGLLKFNRNVYIPKELISNDSLLCEFNDILFNNTNSQDLVGKTALYDKDDRLAFSNHITVLKANKNKILSSYLWIILNVYQRKKIFYSICTNWNNQSGVGLDLLKSLKIPVPKIGEQEKIIEMFQKALQIKKQKETKAKELLVNIDEFLLSELGIKIPAKDNSLSNRIFTTNINKVSGNRFDPFYNNTYFLEVESRIKKNKFSVKKLKELCYTVRGVTYSIKDEIENDKGLGILRANNIDLQTNELILENIRYIRSDFKISYEKLLYANDILMSAASGSKEHVGKVAFIEKDMNFYFGSFMSALRIKSNNVNPKYLFSYLQSKIYRTFLYRVLGGTNINNLNFNMIKDFPIPVPKNKLIQKNISDDVFRLRTKVTKLRREAKEKIRKVHLEVEKIILKE